MRVGIGVGALLLLAILPRVAGACVDPPTSREEARSNLRVAEKSLEARDFSVARELALEVRLGTCNSGYTREPESREVVRRAVRLEALALVRDPSSSEADHRHALDLLMARIGTPEARGALPPTAFYVALGEAFERVGQDKEAIEQLGNPLGDDAYAYAALARAASRQRLGAMASVADARCQVVATDPDVCRGRWPSRSSPSPSPRPSLPLATWNRVRGWGPAGLVLVLLPLISRRRRIAAILEQRLFVLAARRGRIMGLIVRPTEQGDERAPVLYLVFGPKNPETIERQRAPSYRETAREPVLRIARRPLRWRCRARLASEDRDR